MPDLRQKSLSYLREGRVIVLHARTRDRDRMPCEVCAVITPAPGTPGSVVQTVNLADGGGWSCTCQAVCSDGRVCAHVAAVQLATGHPSAAAKPAKAQRRAA